MFFRIKYLRGVYLCWALALPFCPSNAFAYETDFHYYIAYVLIRCRGYDAKNANLLAGFCQYVDDNSKTEPIYCWPSIRAKFHFADSGPDTATIQDNAAVRGRFAAEFTEFLKG